ncbi:predicted protein [Lichtheimia corymbifera JMRC:FSU:9682]|uniref:Uncharacterized protein n=1 Tax=Lichtheimia corymbifera JMRC:FSU:9682 TaxID=1263082 RepID=A0A068RLE3_9FUNG|nr:predicted protein [Lichtheimia corymbifera JMRC:FSU:9682]
MSAGVMRWIRNKKITKKNTIQVPADTLQEGKSYLLRVTSGAHIAIFEGIHEDLYSFLLLRGSMRWVNTSYLVGDFDAFVAFDELSNPLIELWYQLGVSVGQRLPVQWFIMFEEANRKQREANPDDTTSDMIENAIQPKQDNNTIKSTERPRRIGKADSKRTRKKKLHASRHSAAAAAAATSAGLTERKNSSSPSSC